MADVSIGRKRDLCLEDLVIEAAAEIKELIGAKVRVFFLAEYYSHCVLSLYFQCNQLAALPLTAGP